MPRRRHQKVTKCLLCCMGNRMLSDDEDFHDIRQVAPLEERVVETVADQDARPQISTGFLPEAPMMKEVELLESVRADDASSIDENRKISIGMRPSRLSVGDTAPSSDDDDPPQKIVHFAMCHEHEVKDTRDLYRITPLKEKRCQIPCLEEFFFVKSGDAGHVLKVPMKQLMQCVREYVQNIVEMALRAIYVEDFGFKTDSVTRAANDATQNDDAASVSSDDGIDLDSAEENELVNDMVEEVIASVVRQLKREREMAQQSREYREASESSTEQSVSDVSAIASDGLPQFDSCTSLEWDGYEPLLREDPSYTDITIQCAEMSATADVL